MALVTLLSAKARGVTTSALALTLAHPRPCLLAELDPAGGSIRYGLLQGRIPAHQRADGTVEEPGLAALAVAERQDALAEAFEQNLVRLDEAGDRQLLPGVTDPRYASALAGTWEPLTQLLTVMDQQAGYDVVVDAGRAVLDEGRLHSGLTPAPVVHRSDVVLLVVRSTYWALEQARPVAAALRDELRARGNGSEALGLLVVDEGPYPSHEIAHYLQAPVLGLLSWDTAAAAHLEGSGRAPRGFTRSRLLRSARTAADRVEELAQRRRIQLQWGQPSTTPALDGVVQRLRNERGLTARA